MGHEEQFPQRWELRRVNDDSDSSTDDSGSSSKSNPVLKKLELVSSLAPVDNAKAAEAPVLDAEVAEAPVLNAEVAEVPVLNAEVAEVPVLNAEISEPPVLPQKDTAVQSKTGKVKRAQTGKSKKSNSVQVDSKKRNLVENNTRKRSAVQGNSKKRNSVQDKGRDSCKADQKKRKMTPFFDPAMLDELKIFRETLLKDLNATRANLLMSMREELNSLVSENAATTTRRQDGYNEKDIQVQNPNSFGKNQEECQTNIKKKARKQNQNRSKSNKKEQSANGSEKVVKVQRVNLSSSSKSDHSNGELSKKSSKGKKVTVENIPQAARTPPAKERSRVRRSKTSNRPGSKSNSIGQTNEVQHDQSFEIGAENSKSGSISVERSMEGRRTGDLVNFPQFLDKKLGCEQEVELLTSNEKKNAEKCNTSFASNISSNPSNHNSLVQHQVIPESCVRVTDYAGGSLENFIEDKMTSDPDNSYRLLEDQVNRGQATGNITVAARDKGERFGLNYLSNTMGHGASSMHLTLPSVLALPHVDNWRLGSSRNHIQPSVVGNELAVIPESTDLRVFPNMGQGVEIGGFLRIGSRNIVCPNLNGALTSAAGNGFPFSFYEGITNGQTTKVPSQACLVSSPQQINKTEGPRMERGAIKVSGVGNALSGQHQLSNFHNPLMQETAGGLISIRSSADLKEDTSMQK